MSATMQQQEDQRCYQQVNSEAMEDVMMKDEMDDMDHHHGDEEGHHHGMMMMLNPLNRPCYSTMRFLTKPTHQIKNKKILGPPTPTSPCYHHRVVFIILDVRIEVMYDDDDALRTTRSSL